MNVLLTQKLGLRLLKLFEPTVYVVVVCMNKPASEKEGRAQHSQLAV